MPFYYAAPLAAAVEGRGLLLRGPAACLVRLQSGQLASASEGRILLHDLQAVENPPRETTEFERCVVQLESVKLASHSRPKVRCDGSAPPIGNVVRQRRVFRRLMARNEPEKRMMLRLAPLVRL